MTKPNHFARAAMQIGQLADELKPLEGAPYAHSQELAVCYLRLAAGELRKITDKLGELSRAAAK